MTLVVSRETRGLSGVEGQSSGAAIKAQHGCLAINGHRQSILVLSMVAGGGGGK